ncbi:MAG: hypothetical protein ABJO36_12180 [Litorimonas sp.]
MKFITSPKIVKLANNRSKVGALVGLLLLILAIWITASAQAQISSAEKPMESKYSKSIRLEFAKCREKKDLVSQYLCNCEVLAKQCEAPRSLEHGDWNTVEFWPSNNPSEREVQFILFAELDLFGDFAPLNKGIVMTCMAGISEINVFVGNNVNPDVDSTFFLGEKSASVAFDLEDNIFTFEEPSVVYDAFQRGEDVSITYTDTEENERVLEFETYGFDTVSKGWEELCRKASS